MALPNTLNLVSLTDEKSLKTLVENRTAFTLETCELNIFETHQESRAVPLTFSDFVVTSMLRGKKVMHLYENSGFDYLPGESVLVPAGVPMKIDFPEASVATPTQCLALAIDQYKIEQTIHFLNEKYPRYQNNNTWQLDKNEYHFFNNVQLAQNINRIMTICTQDSPMKDIYADLALQELILNIIQLQSLKASDFQVAFEKNKTPLAFVMDFIKNHLTEDIELEALSTKACMSKATFYRCFKREFGISPNEYISLERVKKAKRLLSQSKMSIKEVSFECGFTDVNYFARLFKLKEGISPTQYQQLSAHPNKLMLF